MKRELSEYQRKKIRRLLRYGCNCKTIADAMGLKVKSVAAFMGNEAARKSGRFPVGAMANLVTVKDPEAYMRSKGVWYGEMSMVRSA